MKTKTELLLELIKYLFIVLIICILSNTFLKYQDMKIKNAQLTKEILIDYNNAKK